MPPNFLRHVFSAMPVAPQPGTAGDPGLFGPSLVWDVGRERVLLAGGAAALLLQVAHPLVAAGVSEHSDFGAHPLSRLHATLDATLTITFGDTPQAEAAAAAVRRRHRAVRGLLPARTGSLRAGTPYRADDPELALWVFSTLVWSAVAVREELVGPLAPGQHDIYYGEIKDFGRLFGVPEEHLPQDYAALVSSFGETIKTTLAVGPVARSLAEQILRPPEPVLPWPIRAMPTLLSAALLPPRVRTMYGLTWGRRERLVYGGLRAVTRRVLRVLPSRLRYWPHYETAVERTHRP